MIHLLRIIKVISSMNCFPFPIIISVLFSFLPSTFCQSGAGIFGQLTLPDYNQQYSRPRPLPYANTLWPFPSTYSDQQAYLGQSSRPLFYQQPSSYAWPPPQQQHQQPVQLNDLIAELSIALVRSFAQMLADREINGKGGGPFPLGQGSTAQSRDNIFGIPFAQPPQQQQQQQQPSSPFGSRTTTNFGYGVNAGVFAGTYGGSDSIASPYGPYGPINSQIGGGSFSGLSPWPYIPGRPPISPPTNNANASKPLVPIPPPQLPIPQPPGGIPAEGASIGEGSVEQIPLGENVQGGGAGAEGSGGGELPPAL